jgi:hypothetical protein
LLGLGRAVYGALTKRRPPVRIAIAFNPLVSWILPRFLPARVWDRMLAGIFGLKTLPRLKKEE